VFSFFSASSTSTATAPRPSEVYNPTIILGDLDSLSPTVRTHYEQQGVPCQDLSEDQDSTDLEKCLAYVKDRQADERQRGSDKMDQEDLVVIVGATVLSLVSPNLPVVYCTFFSLSRSVSDIASLFQAM
jgi:hypothetical protein